MSGVDTEILELIVGNLTKLVRRPVAPASEASAIELANAILSTIHTKRQQHELARDARIHGIAA